MEKYHIKKLEKKSKEKSVFEKLQKLLKKRGTLEAT